MPSDSDPSLPPPSPRFRWKSLLVQLIVFVLIAVNLEGFCWYRLRVEGHETATPIATLDPIREWRLLPGRDHEVNDDGLRNRTVPGPHKQGLTRIFCLGGSVTYGLNLKLPETYEMVLQQMLAARAGDRPVEVINGGVQGYATFQFSALLLELGPRYKPDVVTVLAGYNEPHVRCYREDGPTPEQIRSAPKKASTQVRSWLYHSATYRYLIHRLKPDGAAQTPSQGASPRMHIAGDRDWIPLSADNVRYMNEGLKAKNRKLLLMFEARRPAPWLEKNVPAFAMPGRDGASTIRLRKAYETMALAEGIPYIDFQQIFDDTGLPQDTLFQAGDPVHPTPLGNRLIAREMAKKLWELGWVPRQGTSR